MQNVFRIPFALDRYRLPCRVEARIDTIFGRPSGTMLTAKLLKSQNAR